MISLTGPGSRLCDGVTRRDVMRIGGLGALGLMLPDLIKARAATGQKTKSCIVLFLMGGPPQHSTWDPKPSAPAEVRGEFKPMSTNVPGLQICELLPHTGRMMDKVCVLRAVSTSDNAHSSSGYYMLTGVPHQPMNVENVNPGAPNNWPSLPALVRKLRAGPSPLPQTVRLPHRIFNTDGSVWPGQDAGFLGRAADPWLFNCDPSADLRNPELVPADDLPPLRLESRRSLLQQLDHSLTYAELAGRRDREFAQAFDLLRSQQARAAFDLGREPVALRERYGRGPFGQSVLLARRLVEAGTGLVQVNWYRSADEPMDNPCWDSHTKESERLKTVLAPTFDRAFATLIEDLSQRGMLDDTLVACLSEFGRTPRFNGRSGRDHWGFVFSVALAGGGVRGGQAWGTSDAMGGHPKDGRVLPQDLTATILHVLGHRPDTEILDAFNRPIPASRGEVIRQVF
jgi:uncharacterized protein (DUF1501 family)